MKSQAPTPCTLLPKARPLHRAASAGLAAASGLLLTACAHAPGPGMAYNERPGFVAGTPQTLVYDGVADDLLSAGLGRSGLASATAPALSNPPTAAELRRLAIHANYRAIVDTSAGGGFGSLYGPNVDATGQVGSGEGKVAGSETIAYGDDGSGRDNVTMMVQVPASFNPKAPCIVSATSSGSRGVYGAIGSAGEWGLKRGCAVAYTDKGTGTGLHHLADNSVNLIDGRRADATSAGKGAHFRAELSEAQRAALNTATPHRLALKHAHSQRQPEADWGRHTLQAIRFAFWVLNERFGHAMPDGRRHITIVPANTVVMASSVSNGAAAALAAAELDDAGLIDGVAVSEPQVAVAPGGGRIERAGLAPYTVGSRPLMHYVSYANLLQPCAALAEAAKGSPFAFNPAVSALAANRCAALARAGLVAGASTAEQAADALAKLLAHGWEPESTLLHASHYLFATPAIATTYANSLGRFGVAEHLCGYSFATVDASGAPAAAAAGAFNGLFGSGNGIPPTGPIQLVYNDSVGGARNHTLATSPSTNTADLAFDGANCLRQLVTGTTANALRVQRGVTEVQRTANLRGKPTLIVQGRADALVPANFSARPYAMANARVEGAASRLRYIEVANAQHFDAFLPLPGYDSRFVPLHLYFVRAMDAMWAHLTQGQPLPQSQLVRTTARGGSPGAVPALTAANVPPIAATPAAADRIDLSGSLMRLP